jgi:hypothetical protein
MRRDTMKVVPVSKRDLLCAKYSNFSTSKNVNRLSNSRVVKSIFELNSELGSNFSYILNHCEKTLILLFNLELRDYGTSKVNLIENTYKRIIHNGLEKELLHALYYCYLQISNKRDVRFFDNMFRELSDLWDFFFFEDGKYLIGVDGRNHITIDRPFYSDSIKYMDWEYRYKHKLLPEQISAKVIRQMLSENIDSKMSYDVNVSKAICITAIAINNNTSSIIPTSWEIQKEKVDGRKKVFLDFIEDEQDGDRLSDSITLLVPKGPKEGYAKRLATRNKRIVPKGVKIFLDGPVFVEWIEFKESLGYNNTPMVVFNAKVLGRTFSFIGIIDILKGKILHTISDSDRSMASSSLEDLVMEMYTLLTCDDCGIQSRLFPMTEYNPYRVDRIWYEIDMPSTHSTVLSRLHKSGATQIPHERTYAVRKLPEKWKTSERAKSNALKYGIVLKEGETFVPPYFVGRENVTEELK